MDPSSKQRDLELYRQGQLVTALSRWISLALGFVALWFLWDSPKLMRGPALATGLAYAAFAVGAYLWSRGRPRSRGLKITHDLVDAVTIGLGAAMSGGLDSPIWLFLYPHVAAVSARRGLAIASAVGVLDATILLLLVGMTPGHPMGSLHALTLLACAVMGGTTSSYLHQIQARLSKTNVELSERELDVRTHAERLSAINAIASAVGVSLTTDDVLGAAADQIRRFIPCDRLTAALHSEEAGGLELVCLDGEIRRAAASFSPEDVGWAFRGPLTWCHGGEGAAPPQMQALLSEPDIQAVATVPLHSKNRLLGSLNLGRLKPHPFSAEDLSVMEPAARHLATALDNARLLRTVLRRGQEFGSLLEIGRAILERLELRELLPLVTHSVNQLMGTHYCILLLRSEDRLVVGAQVGLEPEVIDLVNGMRVGESLSGWVADHGEPLTVPHMAADSRLKFRAVVEKHGYRSYLCVPLRRGTEVLGTLEVVTKDARVFGQEEQELMSAFADQAAIAIDHARLFEQTRSNLERLEEANRMLEGLDRLRRQYLRNVSHEFRTPLTVIRGYAEFLRDTEPPSEASLKHVMKVIIESCDRVIDMVDTLLEVSRVEQEMASDTLRVQDLSLEDLVGQSVERLQPTADRRSISLSVEFRDSPLSLQGDHGLLLQVVRKLLDNAVKYSPEGARVVVRGSTEGESLSLQVQDDGIGISSEHLGRIFDKFYMVDGGIARQVGGTGVGLYLVREIVKLHKGVVDVRSQPGQGSLFSVTLPREFQGARPQVAMP